MIITLALITTGALAYTFCGNVTAIVTSKKMYDHTDLNRLDSKLWGMVFGVVWPIVIPAMLTWSGATKTVKALETRQERKQLAEAKVVKE